METLTEETKRSEFERRMQRVLQEHLRAEHRATWPSQAKRDLYYGAFAEFAVWCKDRDFSAMPSDGWVISAFLIEARQAGATIAQLRCLMQAIEFFHMVHGAYVDILPVRSALRWARTKEAA
jgi:hypothetical protein